MAKAPECPWSIWITLVLSAETALPDVWWVGAQWKDEMDEQLGILVKGFKLFNPHLLKYSFIWRCPCVLFKDKGSYHPQKMCMSNLKDYNTYNDLALCLSFLEHFVIGVRVIHHLKLSSLIWFILFSIWRAWANSLPLCWHKILFLKNTSTYLNLGDWINKL